MSKIISISLGDYFEKFIQGRINEGRYKDASEVVIAGLRLLEEEQKRVALSQALQEGIDSGIAHNFDPNEFLETLNSQRKENT